MGSVPTEVVSSTTDPSKLSDLIPIPHWFNQNFSNCELESKFRNYFFIRRKQLIRVTLPCLLIGFTALGISYDVLFVANSSVLYYNRILRYAVQLPIIAIFWILTYTQFYINHIQSLNVILGLTLGGVNIALAIIGGQPDHGPQMLYFFVVYQFFQLRFLYASFVCWTLYFAFIIAVKFTVNSSKLGLSIGYMTVSNFALMFACYVTEYWLRLEFTRHNKLILEEQRTDDLLQTLLPERITLKLKDLKPGDNLIAEEFNNVSILFSDIVGFTQYSASISAREVVNFLNTLYTTFDHLTVLHEVLKVETIGDSYFVASGVLEPRNDHCDLLAAMAFDMCYILQQFKCKNDFKLEMRIGLHSGRVIAGVVGLKVPRYHLFGDCVTIASLMESTGKPNKIQVSQSVYNELCDKPEYILELRSDEDKENKRKNVPTYFLYNAITQGSYIQQAEAANQQQ